MNLRKLFAKAVENWPVKVLSIGLAVILFVFHRFSALETRFFYVPLVIEQLSALTPADSYPRMIRVNLRGESDKLYHILEEDIEAFVDMSKSISPGTYVVPVQWRKKGTAEGADPLQITVDPVEIAFSLDYKISKYVPVTANIRGQVEGGYSLTSFSLNPNRIIIDGPAGLLGGISELHTDFINLDGRRGDFTETVSILNSDPLIEIRGNETTEFHGTVNRIIPVRNISMVPLTVTGVRDGFTAEPEIRTVNIHLEGENQDAIDSFVLPPDFVKIDCSAIGESGIYILKVLAGTADNLAVTVTPEEVRVQIVYSGDTRP